MSPVVAVLSAVVLGSGAGQQRSHESMRYSLEQLEGWMRAAGMSRVAEHGWLVNSFFVIYRVGS